MFRCASLISFTIYQKYECYAPSNEWNYTPISCKLWKEMPRSTCSFAYRVKKIIISISCVNFWHKFSIDSFGFWRVFCYAVAIRSGLRVRGGVINWLHARQRRSHSNYSNLVLWHILTRSLSADVQQNQQSTDDKWWLVWLLAHSSAGFTPSFGQLPSKIIIFRYFCNNNRTNRCLPPHEHLFIAVF